MANLPDNHSSSNENHGAVSAAEVLARVRISDVAQSLGVNLDRTGRRCVASWRDGRKFSVSLNDDKNAWHDFVAGEGGGVVDFVARVLRSDRQSALEWLAGYAGVQLSSSTKTERRDWARRMRAAEPEARKLVTWKLETLEALRIERNSLLRIYHRAKAFIIHNDINDCARRGDLRFDAALAVGWSFWPRICMLDQQIDRLEAASYTDLLKQLGLSA
jgi:hypothetical protein